MSSNARDASGYASFPRANTPVFPYHEDPSASVVALPSVEQPWADVQDLRLYQTVDLGSNPNVAQQFPIALQNSMTQPVPISQEISMTMENSRLPREQSDPSGESATEQTNWSLEPNKDDWERHRSQITDLYRDNPLKEVMDIMKREHGIKASAKMYKDRINKWKIDKKIKGEEMKAIIRKQTQRSQAGKKSAFRIRNSQVSELKIARYRKTMRLSSEERALMLRATTPPGLVCYTPLASPLATPRALETPERIARLIQEYIDGSFDSETWLVTEQQICISRKGSGNPIFDFEERCTHAAHMITNGETREGWQGFNMAMALIEQIVSAESPDTLRVLAIQVLSLWFFYDLREIASTLLNQFSAISAAIKPQMHPFNHIFALLVDLETSHLENTFSIISQSQVDCFARRSGRYSWDTLELQLSMLLWEPRATAVQTKERCLVLLRECENTLGTFDERSLIVRENLARHYLCRSEFEEATKIAEIIPSLAAQSQGYDAILISDALYILSWAQFKLSKPDLAERNILQAIHIEISDYGLENDHVLQLMSDLELWLKEWNRPDEAAELRRQRKEVFGLTLERSNREEEERYRRCQVSEF